MKFTGKIILGIIVYGMFLSSDSKAQTECEITNAGFRVFWECANAHLKKTKYYDPLQRKYANMFYEYYETNPDADLAGDALLDAIIMWMNIKEYEKFEKALAGIDDESVIWNELVVILAHSNYYKNTYPEEFIDHLKNLRDKLTDPDSKTVAFSNLASFYREQGDKESEMELYREIVQLDTDWFYKEFARKELYEYEHLQLGGPAPEFTIVSVGGDTLSLQDLKGKTVVLYFWITHSGLLSIEVPFFNELKSKYSDKDFQIVWLCIEKDGEKFVESLKDFSLKSPQFWLSGGNENEVAKRYNILYGPRIFVLDKSGKIVSKDQRGEDLEKILAELMGK